jgi:SAM-dependent methyltransferase
MTSANDCILSCGGKVAGITHLYSARDIVFRRRVGACRNCGHVQIVPVYNEDAQKKINALSHTHFVTGGNQDNNRRKKEQTLARSSRFLNGKKTMLDVGSGEGWSQEIANQYQMSYSVIEQMEALHPRLAATGAQVVATSIKSLSGTYDFIIFRHVLEHLINPLQDLQHLADSLSSDGILYIALPDFNQLVGRKGYRTNSLRPGHISYFTINKLLWLLSRSGLQPLAYGEDGELWVIASKGKYRCDMENEFDRNALRIREMVRRNIKGDLLNMLRYIFYKIRASLKSYLPEKLSRHAGEACT